MSTEPDLEAMERLALAEAGVEPPPTEPPAKLPKVIAECVQFEIFPEERARPKEGETEGKVTRKRRQITTRTRLVKLAHRTYEAEQSTKQDAMGQHVWHDAYLATSHNTERLYLLIDSARNGAAVIEAEKPEGWLEEGT